MASEQVANVAWCQPLILVTTAERPQLAEARRVCAVKLFGQDRSNAEIAQMVGVHAESVRRWRRAWENGGTQTLRGSRQPVAGRSWTTPRWSRCGPCWSGSAWWWSG
ncbi:hypothetical protein CW362_14290 [Streptomyces populi]|uniref:Uncharacterized protein n=1 Tax=Streptomyces populi TaxID=2058924 RepID=A0A2I0SQR5_9ACTN|nr:hypothetical protein CW362_14290 [Streptomyces populi]